MATFPSISSFVSDYARQNAVSRLSPERRPAPEPPAPATPEPTAAQQVQRTSDHVPVEEPPPPTAAEEYQYNPTGEVVPPVNAQADLGRRLNITV